VEGEMRFLGMIIRWLLAGICVGGGIFLLNKTPEGDFAKASGLTLISVAGFLGAVFLVVPETVTPLAEFIGTCFSSIIFPNAKFSKPPLSYFLADLYSKQMRYEEAARQYMAIIRYYPNEQKAYLELISICQLSGETKLAKKYLRRFNRRFKPQSLGKKRRRGPRWF
jgi:tetratricopeptide (TPR) repeat protein